jgi:hypothetical protein
MTRITDRRSIVLGGLALAASSAGSRRATATLSDEACKTKQQPWDGKTEFPPTSGGPYQLVIDYWRLDLFEGSRAHRFRETFRMPDFAAVKADGVRGVICKAHKLIESTIDNRVCEAWDVANQKYECLEPTNPLRSLYDPLLKALYLEDRRSAKAAGLLWGSYWFGGNLNIKNEEVSGRAQARAYLAQITSFQSEDYVKSKASGNALGRFHENDLVCLDWEPIATASGKPDTRLWMSSKAAVEFTDEIQLRLGRYPILNTSSYFLDELNAMELDPKSKTLNRYDPNSANNINELVKRCNLWLSNYVSLGVPLTGPKMSGRWFTQSPKTFANGKVLWQGADDVSEDFAVCRGVKRKWIKSFPQHDLNILRGDEKQLERFWTSSTS